MSTFLDLCCALLFILSIIYSHVKMRSLNQGLGSIPASKKGFLGVIPESTTCSFETEPSEYWELSQNIILWTLGLIPEPLIPSSGI